MHRPWMVILTTLALLAWDKTAAAGDADIYDADGMVPGWLCEPCRSPSEYPTDFAAFAYNAYWGPNAWAWDSTLGIPFRIYNRRLEWVVVWFEDVLFKVPSFLPDTMQIKLRLPTGEVISIEVIKGGPEMPIGVDEEPGVPSYSCGCMAGSGSGGSYLEPEIDMGWDDPGDLIYSLWSTPVGVVEIVDL